VSVRFIVLSVVTSLTVAVAGVATTTRASGAANDPGRVVSAKARPGGGYELRYRSIGLNGRAVEETAAVWLPPKDRRTGDVVAWAHSTTGVADHCAPSAQRTVDVPGLGALLDAGEVVVAPDYEGLGTSGVHPYLVGISEGRSVLDALRAARTFAKVRGRSVAYGWSQGGHAVLFAGKLAPTYAADVRLAGVAGIAPVTSVASLVDGSSALSRKPGYVAMVAAGFLAAYPELDPSALLGDPDEQLAAARRVCGIAPELDDTVTKTTFDPAWRERLDENDPSTSLITVPVLFALAADDQLLAPDEAVSSAQELCNAGSVVQLVRYQGTDHLSVATTALPDLLRWLGDRLSGRTAHVCMQRDASSR
jgi:acetyl esterase/lipase